MSPWSLVFVVPAVATVAIGAAAASDQDPVPLFTGEDLDRMFGPAPAQPSEPVDKTSPEDWRWVEQFLDRQYSRIDADRGYDLSRRAMDIAARRSGPTPLAYEGPVAWSLRYPASTWWNAVSSTYLRATNGSHERHGGHGHRSK